MPTQAGFLSARCGETFSANSRKDPSAVPRKDLAKLQQRLSTIESDGCPGLLPERSCGLPDRTRSLHERAGDPGAGPGMETDEEVALSAEEWIMCFLVR
jgi:hypothetical protein